MASRVITRDEEQDLFKAALYALISAHRAEFENILYNKKKEFLNGA